MRHYAVLSASYELAFVVFMGLNLQNEAETCSEKCSRR